eukprot:CAMPEP_0173238648 /NCGR_PEP_ID=MMETSP1142-20121109/12762_1 /TAXON_ID=483371 /ORGANISM="non described non described, Strain CCMP2298" /LENGTH=181 /DNA_ID=CAMNT_0014169551 /DNA_START=144 /DNA_END=689 /DNA_ORIENTATION=-
MMIARASIQLFFLCFIFSSSAIFGFVFSSGVGSSALGGNGITRGASFLAPSVRRASPLFAEIAEFDDEEEAAEEVKELRTHGYEGDFKVGDTVRVNKNIRIWSVKKYQKEGFLIEGFVGKVQALALYGRKLNTLCSAITPVKVEFLPDGEGVPAGMFERKWLVHFEASELDLVEAAVADCQ